jgi:hypothetical protein
VAREILRTRRPFEPTDRDLFHTFFRADWRDVAPLAMPAGRPATEAATRTSLRSFLERRFPCDPERVLDGIAVYNDPLARQKVPEPTLRAALASLVGTIGEPAIPWALQRAPVTSIHFGVYLLRGEGIPTHFAGTYKFSDGTQRAIFDGRFRTLPFGAFAGLLFHEILHLAPDDDGAGLPEEVAAASLEALVYMQTLLVDPSLARLPDELTRWSNNHMALVRLNSAPVGSDRLALLVPDGTVNIDPLGAELLTQFHDYRAAYDAPAEGGFREVETAGNALLADVLQSIAEPGVTPPEDPDFDRETLEFIDGNQAALTSMELVRVACILRLDVPCPMGR